MEISEVAKNVPSKVTRTGNVQREGSSSNSNEPRMSKQQNLSKYIQSHRTFDSFAEEGRTPVEPRRTGQQEVSGKEKGISASK